VEVNLSILYVLVLNEIGGEVDGADIVVVDKGTLHQWSIKLMK
jgi:hypothetical protein